MKSNWKSTPLLAVISVVSSVFVCLGILQMTRLSFFGGAGIALWLVLFALTIAASRLTVSITNTESGQNNRKSLAEAFVFLAVILYAAPPPSIVGPPLCGAAFVGFASTYGLSTRREMIVTIGMSVISTYVAASSYGILIDFFEGQSLLPASSLPLSVVLVPLFALAILQYLLN